MSVKSKLRKLRSKITGIDTECLIRDFNTQFRQLENAIDGILSQLSELKSEITHYELKMNNNMGEFSINDAGNISTNLSHIILDYPVNAIPRYGFGKQPHKQLYNIIDKNRHMYENYIVMAYGYKDNLKKIPKYSENCTEPYWNNGWFEGIDAAILYTFIHSYKPKNYIEIGSGNSTKFTRRAIVDGHLNTKLISIDPCPRSEIDSICDKVIRQPLEDIDVSFFDQLESGDILFVDNSHRVLMNSDATVVFLDILPRLKKGVIVHFHDILLPYDYPPEWAKRLYSEQYMLALLLLTQHPYKILFPCCFVHNDPELSSQEDVIFADMDVNRSGCSFWIEV